MKKLFSVFLVVNLLAETMAASVPIGGPGGITAAGDQPAGTVIHAVLAAMSVVLFAQRRRWCIL
jgi:hypothetical protein